MSHKHVDSDARLGRDADPAHPLAREVLAVTEHVAERSLLLELCEVFLQQRKPESERIRIWELLIALNA